MVKGKKSTGAPAQYRAQKQPKQQKPKQQRGGPAGPIVSAGGRTARFAGGVIVPVIRNVATSAAPRGGGFTAGMSVRNGHQVWRFHFKEILQEVTASAGGDATWSQDISPSLTTRNVTLKALFDLCHIVSVTIHWVPYVSLQGTGVMYSATDYNKALGSFPTTITAIAKYEKAVPQNAYVPWSHSVVWRDRIDRETDVSPEATSHRPDGITYTVGLVGKALPSGVVGNVSVDMWIEYSSLKA